jgi:hypothetical protein
MTTGHKATWALVALLALLLVWEGRSWLQAHDEALQYKVQQKADNAAAVSIAQKEAANQALLQQTVAALGQTKVTVRTPAQVVQALPQVMELPQPVHEVTVQQADAANAGQLPGAPTLAGGDLVIPAADAKAFYDAQVDCKIGAAKLASCTETVANDQALRAVKETELAQLQTALKGGTKWQRTKRALLWAGVGVGVGAAGVLYAEHR